MALVGNLIGQRFGRLVVRERAGYANYGKAQHVQWRCVCDCGTACLTTGNNLRADNTKSCGCLSRETTADRNRTHGQSRTREYRAWRAMLDRCYLPSAGSFPLYGGRGIGVCDRWRGSFQNFYADLGVCPTDRSLDRRDSNGNYEPDNCRWATATEQANNKRNSLFIEVDGQRLTATEAARKYGVASWTANRRARAGLPIGAPPRKKALATYCIHGHALFGDNAYFRRDGSRKCRTCAREWMRHKRP